jgi:hypothetical protein
MSQFVKCCFRLTHLEKIYKQWKRVSYLFQQWKYYLEHIDRSVQNKIENKYVNPTKYVYNVSLQSHSITIVFKEHGKEKFAVDIVPAYV